MGTASNVLSTERRELTATRLGTRVAILAAGHLTMIGVFFVLVEAYEPDPAGLRFESLTGFVSFVAVTSAPVVVGLFAQRRRAVVLIALLQAVSPLVLLPDLSAGNEITFLLLLWWFPIPVLAALILAFDQFSIARCNKRMYAAENMTLPPPERVAR